MNYLAFGQIAFFGDFGNGGSTDVSACAKFYGDSCAVNYGIRAHVCVGNQTIGDCTVACDLFLEVAGSNLLTPGASTICKRILTCNLASCPDPNVCLGPGDPMGCSPVANLNNGERIIYELYDNDQSLSGVGAIIPEVMVADNSKPWWIGLVVGLVVLAVVATAIAVILYVKRKRVTETF